MLNDDVKKGPPLFPGGPPKYFYIKEKNTKTRHGGKNEKRDLEMQIWGDPSNPAKCPVTTFLFYESKKTPLQRLPNVQFLRPINHAWSKDSTAEWYKGIEGYNIGEKTIEKLLVRAVDKAGFNAKELGISASSARKSLVEAASRANVNPSILAKHMGHKFLGSHLHYLEGSVEAHEATNKAISRTLSGLPNNNYEDILAEAQRANGMFSGSSSGPVVSTPSSAPVVSTSSCSGPVVPTFSSAPGVPSSMVPASSSGPVVPTFSSGNLVPTSSCALDPAGFHHHNAAASNLLHNSLPPQNSWNSGRVSKSTMFKVCFKKHDEKVEFRRFQLDYIDYTRLKKQLEAYNDNKIITTISWTDTDGDEIKITNTEDLLSAVQMQGTCVRLSVQIEQPTLPYPPASPPLHRHHRGPAAAYGDNMDLRNNNGECRPCIKTISKCILTSCLHMLLGHLSTRIFTVRGGYKYSLHICLYHIMVSVTSGVSVIAINVHNA